MENIALSCYQASIFADILSIFSHSNAAENREFGFYFSLHIPADFL